MIPESEPERAASEPPGGSATDAVRDALPDAALTDGSSAARRRALARPDQATHISARSPVPGPAGPLSADFSPGLEGERLEHFEIERFIGGGGMGAVYLARDTRLDRLVALKVLARESVRDDEILRRFLNEAQSAARLDHENIARVYYVGEDRGLHFIAFEYVEGSNLRDLVESRGPLPIADTVRYGVQVAEALGHASQRDVVHRDIKPSNVLLTPMGRVKLVDMGLARLHHVDRSNDDLTASGVTLGTFDYISPEQARDPRLADVRSDIYSWGCTLFFMLTGRPPFPEGTVLQKLLQHQGDEPPDPRQLRSDVPVGLSRIVLRALSKDPRQRYQTANALVGDLWLLSHDLGLPAASPVELAWAAGETAGGSFWDRHLPWIAPVAALLLAVAALDAWTRWSQDQVVGARVRPPDYSRSKVIEKLAPAAVPQVPLATLESPDPQTRELFGASQTAREDVSTIDRVDAPPRLVPPETVVTQAEVKEPVGVPPVGQSPPEDLPETANPLLGVVVARSGWRVSDTAGAWSLAPSSGGLGPEGLRSPTPTGSSPFASDAPRTSILPTDEVLVVGDVVDGRRQFNSLHAACAAAADGEVIELRFSGRREEPPFALRDRAISIRAGVGFRPTVAFRLAASDDAPRQAVSLTGGRLTTVGVAWELQLPTTGLPVENWALFGCDQVESLRCQRCQITLKNAARDGGAYQPGAVMVDATAGRTQVGRRATSLVRLDDCIVRGEAGLLRALADQPVRLEWSNGLCALADVVLAIGGAVATSDDAVVQADLEHVTLVLGKGFMRYAETTLGVRADIVSVHVANSLLVGGARAAVLERWEGPGQDDLRRRARWTGERNFYEGFSAFSRVVDATSGSIVHETAWSEWKSFWSGSRERWGPIGWERPPAANARASEATLNSVRLAPQAAAKGAGNDLADAGLIAQRLLSVGDDEPLLESDVESLSPPAP